MRGRQERQRGDVTTEAEVTVRHLLSGSQRARNAEAGKGRETHSPPEPPEGTQSRQYLGFSEVRCILDFWLPEVQGGW